MCGSGNSTVNTETYIRLSSVQFTFLELGQFVPKCCYIQTKQIFPLGILLQNLRTLDLALRTSVKFIFPDGFIYRKSKVRLQEVALQCKIRGVFLFEHKPTN